jgi:hypothetical protein
LGTITGDQRLFLMRTLHFVVPHGDTALPLSFQYPVGGPPFDEFEYNGHRLIRVLVDPRKPRRCHPIPKAEGSEV